MLNPRYSVILVSRSTSKPIGLLIADCSQSHASAFVRHFNKRIRVNHPDHLAVVVPVI